MGERRLGGAGVLGGGFGRRWAVRSGAAGGGRGGGLAGVAGAAGGL